MKSDLLLRGAIVYVYLIARPNLDQVVTRVIRNDFSEKYPCTRGGDDIGHQSIAVLNLCSISSRGATRALHMLCDIRSRDHHRRGKRRLLVILRAVLPSYI